MKIMNDSRTEANRASWRRNSSGRLLTHHVLSGRPIGPTPSFEWLLGRLSRGRLNPQVARDLLKIPSDHIVLNIRIDRDTGLVAGWNLRMVGASPPASKIVANEAASAA